MFFAGATVLYTFPLVFHLRTAVMPGRGDYPSETALIAWSARQLVRNPSHLFDTEFFYPNSNTHVYWQSVLVPGAMAAPVLALIGDPLLATNVVLCTALVLSGIFAFGLAYSLTGCLGPSLVAGVLFAYFPNRMEQLGTIVVQMGFLLPAALWAFLRFLAGQRWRDLLLTLVCVSGQMLSSLYYGFAFAFLLLGVFVTRALLRPDVCSRRLFARGALGLALLGLALFPFLRPYLEVHRALGFERDVGLAEWFGMDLLSFLDPGAFSTLYRGHLLAMGHSEGGLFPGFVALGLVGVALSRFHRHRVDGARPSWAAWAWGGLGATAALAVLALVTIPWVGPLSLHAGSLRLLRVDTLTLAVSTLPLLGVAAIALEGRRRRRGPLSTREWVLTLVLLTVSTYLLTLTPTLTIHGRPWGVTPVRWLYEYVPATAAFRAPGRWALVFVLPLALLAAFGAAALADCFRGRARRVILGLVLAAVMVDCLDLPIPWMLLPPVPPVYQGLAREPGDFAVAQFPVSDSGTAAWAMFWDTAAHKRLVTGALVFVPPTLQALADAEGPPFRPEALVGLLRSIYPLRDVIVHRPGLPVEELAGWERLRTQVGPGIRFLRRFGDDDLFHVAGTPEAGVDLHRWFSVDFVRDHPAVYYAVRFASDDPEVRRWIDVSFNERGLDRVEADDARTLRLPPPYRVGDRNEIRFVLRYAVTSAVTRGSRYRIGRTSAYSPVDLDVQSGGKFSGNTVSVRSMGSRPSRCPGAATPSSPWTHETAGSSSREPSIPSGARVSPGGWPSSSTGSPEGPSLSLPSSTTAAGS